MIIACEDDISFQIGKVQILVQSISVFTSSCLKIYEYMVYSWSDFVFIPSIQVDLFVTHVSNKPFLVFRMKNKPLFGINLSNTLTKRLVALESLEKYLASDVQCVSKSRNNLEMNVPLVCKIIKLRRWWCRQTFWLHAFWGLGLALKNLEILEYIFTHNLSPHNWNTFYILG